MQHVHKKNSVFCVLLSLITIFVIVAVLFKPVLKLVYPVKYTSYINKYSTLYSLDKFLVMGIISTESKFDANARSHKNAKGLMQLKDSTASWCAENSNISCDSSDLFEPEVNIQIGCAYIRYLLDKYNGNVRHALAAYNAGEGNVSKWLENGNGKELKIPFKETENYVKRVEKRMKIYRFLYG